MSTLHSIIVVSYSVIIVILTLALDGQIKRVNKLEEKIESIDDMMWHISRDTESKYSVTRQNMKEIDQRQQDLNSRINKHLLMHMTKGDF